MSTNKHLDKICIAGIVLAVLIVAAFCMGEKIGIQPAATAMAYENKLFDTTQVHTLDISMDNWDEFIASATDEEYSPCIVTIDGEVYANVGLRAKGNTSLTQVKSYGNDRYSFKLEFDHYDSGLNYHGLDKLCLNNIIQDNTYMKDYLVYRMMGDFGVAAPLCSYTYITVNGEDWGLYLAVEGVEESFLQRNFGKNYGELYKPDSMSMGGGRGNGKDFDQEKFDEKFDGEPPQMPDDFNPDDFNPNDEAKNDFNPDEFNHDDEAQNDFNPDEFKPEQKPDFQPNGRGENDRGNNPEEAGRGGGRGDGGKGGMMGSSDDVLLKYVDDEIDSYANIFDSAKTEISKADQKRLIAALKTLSSENAADAVDVDAVLRYFVVHNFVLNFDSYTGSMIHNYYLYEDDGVLAMLPWDYNLAFGGFQQMGGAESLINYPIDTPVSGGSVDDRPMLAWIFANEEYTELYHQYFAEFIADYFDSGKFSAMMDEVYDLIAPYVEKDPTKFCTYDEFTEGFTTLREFCLLRAQSVAAQLDGTLGSTADTQNTEDYITADDLVISAMGSMNGAMDQPGNNGDTPDMPNKRPNESEQNGDMRPGGGRPGTQPPNMNGAPPDMPNNTPFDNMPDNMPQNADKI